VKHLRGVLALVLVACATPAILIDQNPGPCGSSVDAIVCGGECCWGFCNAYGKCEGKGQVPTAWGKELADAGDAGRDAHDE